MSTNQQPTVTLFFPPYCTSPEPPLALACLTAFQHNRGISCQAVDLNVRYFRWKTGPGGLLEQNVRRHVERYRELQSSNPRSGLSAEEVAELGQVARAIGIASEHLHHLVASGNGAVAGAEPDAEPDRAVDGWIATPEGVAFHAVESIDLPLSVEAVLQAVAKAGSVTCIDDFFATSQVADLIATAGRSEVVGINVSFASQLYSACLLSDLVRLASPGVFIVWGGTQVTLLSDHDRRRLLSLPRVDALCVHDGELPLYDLVRRLAAGRSLAGIPNLLLSQEGSEPVSGPVGTPPPLDDLPTPYFDDDELQLYPCQHTDLPVLVTRGCYWGRCTFCDYPKLMTGERGFAVRSAKRVVADIKTLQARHRAFRFSLISDALPPAWSRSFAREVLARRVSASFAAFIRNEPKDTWDQSLLHLMAQAGFSLLTCGAEATSNRLLELIDKGTSLSNIEDNLRMLAAADIGVTFNLIPDFPTTTPEEAKACLDFVSRHRDLIHYLNHQSFDLSQHSAIARHPRDFGIEVDPHDTLATQHGAHRLAFRHTSGLSDEQRAAVLEAFEHLKREVGLYHQTVANRERIAAAGFDWWKATFVLRRCLVLHSRFSLRRRGRPAQVCLIVNPIGDSVFEVDDSFSDLAELFASGAGRPISFHHFRELLVRGLANDRAGRGEAAEILECFDQQVTSACIDWLTRLVEDGMVWRVLVEAAPADGSCGEGG